MVDQQDNALKSLQNFESAPSSKGDLGRFREENIAQHKELMEQIKAQGVDTQKTILAGQEKMEQTIKSRFKRVELGLFFGSLAFAIVFSFLTSWLLGLWRSMFGIV